MPKLLSVNVGMPRDATWRGEVVRTAIFKEPVAGRVALRGHNLDGDAQADLAFIAAQIKRLDPLPPRLHWALSPSGPQRCSPALLQGIAELSERHNLPVTTHVVGETEAQRRDPHVTFVYI